MGKTYQIKSAQRRDEWQSKFGAMVDYALTLEGVEGFVKLSQKVETAPPRDNSEIYGLITQETNRNGTSYQKFKKQNPDYEERSETSSTPTSSQSEEKLDYIVQMLEVLLGKRDVEDLQSPGSSVSNGSEPMPDDPFGGLGL